MSRVLTVLTVAAYVVLVARAITTPEAPAALGLGLAFVLVAVFGFDRVRSAALPWRVGYLLVQVGLAFAVFDAANASIGATLLVVVLVIQSVLALPLPVAVAVTLVTPLMHLGMGWSDGWREGLGTLAAAVFAAVVTWLLTREQAAREQLQVANTRLAQLAEQAQQLATTRERNRVARDIHDGLGHHLTVIGMQIQAARAIGATDPRSADAVLGKAQQQAGDALADVRRSVRVLREPRQWDSLIDAVRELATGAAALGPEVGLQVEGEPRQLPADVEETMYRVAQEGLTNAGKHAHARTVRITLAYGRPDGAVVTVTDDGAGTAATSPDGGFGLVGLRERVARLAGTLEFTSEPGAGSTLRASLPA